MTALTFKSAPRITVDTFCKVLRDAHSPAAASDEDMRSLYSIFCNFGVDPGVGLAFFAHESSYGTQGRAQDNLSWGNVRLPQNKALSTGLDKDGFARYGSWLDSAADWCERILERYIPAGWGDVDVAIPHYAPAGPPDYNQPEAYKRAVHGLLDQYGIIDALFKTNYLALWGTSAPYRPDWGIPSRWRKEYDAGRPLGRALSDEYTTGQYTTQAFELGYVRYANSNTEVYRRA